MEKEAIEHERDHDLLTGLLNRRAFNRIMKHLFSNCLLYTSDDYLKMTRRDILTTKGRVTHKQALEKAHGEYKKYRKKQEDSLSPVEYHFLESIEKLHRLEEKN